MQHILVGLKVSDFGNEMARRTPSNRKLIPKKTLWRLEDSTIIALGQGAPPHILSYASVTMNETSTTAETWPEAPFQFDVGGPLNTVELSTFLDRENAKNYELGNPEYYLPKWMEILYGRGKFAGFNWAAAIFGWLWCLYRKQYKLAITVALLEGLVIPIIVGLSLGFIFGEAAIRPYFETFGTYCGILFVRPWLGFAANPRYLRRAADVIAIARQSAGNELELIQKHGGTSTIALVTGLIINTGLVLYDAYLSIDTSI